MRKLIITLLILAVIGTAIAFGGRKAYRTWKSNRAVASAKVALGKGEYTRAGIWLRKAISSNSRNTEAIRLMGDFTEMTGLSSSVYWRQRLLEIDPQSVSNRLLLARTAISFRDPSTAKRTLDTIVDPGQAKEEYLKLKGVLAVMTDQLPEAEKHFDQLNKLEPGNSVVALNLGMLRILHTRPETAQSGREILERLRNEATVRTDVLRHLTADALRHTNIVRALTLATELASTTNCSYRDKLLRLTILQNARMKEIDGVLETYKKEARTNAPHAYELSRWMLNATDPSKALNWLNSLSPLIATNPPVSLCLADALLASKQWSQLHETTRLQYWGELDHLRLVFASRALREQSLTTAAQAEWQESLRRAGGRLDRLSALYNVTSNWRWITESEQVLWQIVSKFPKEKWAVQSLSNLLRDGGKTRSLLTLYAQEAHLEPQNLSVKANLAFVALLLNAEQYQPHELARQVFEFQPTNPTFATAYAYSLTLQNRSLDALKVMERLPLETLRHPSVAGYYGLILANIGDQSRAKQFLDLTSTARLLPEEANIFRRPTQ